MPPSMLTDCGPIGEVSDSLPQKNRMWGPIAAVSFWSGMAFMALSLSGRAAETPAAAETAVEETAPEAARFFEREVRPLLAERCFKCHGESKQSAGLRLDVRANALAGGETGPSVVPGQVAESLLISAINYESFEMPPDGKLPEREIEILTRWVTMGAPWPGDDRPAAKVYIPGQMTPEERAWWAFQPIQRPALPDESFPGWSQNGVDRFIGASLKKNGLEPAPAADRRTLIRRLTYDLTGLPPTPTQVENFLADTSEEAYARLVERLLNSPQYGQRWARLWLDLVRYAESDGYRADDFRPNAFRYRDYVINAFNNDKPYDRFVQEQLAGDELFPGDPEALTATAYLRQGIYEYNNRDARGQWDVILNDITDTTADVFMGMGLQCARCHDHKFDPLLQADYYRLQSFFAGLLPQQGVVAATAEERARHAEALRPWEEKTAAILARIDELEAPAKAAAAAESIGRFPEDVQAMIAKPVDQRTPYEHQVAELAYRQVHVEWDRIEKRLKGEVKDQVLALRKELSQFDSLQPAALPLVDVVTNVPFGAAETVIPRKGTKIEPGFLTILSPEPAIIPPLAEDRPSAGRRAALAQWLIAPENPLTSRVMANRLWQQHFGRGLAVNTSDFGRLGEAPTHPELLDWLACELRDNQWSLKHLHRLMVLSATYRQSADHPDMEQVRLKDPENKWLSHAIVRRLDAEQIRDSLYAVSGALNLDVAGGVSVPTDQPVRSIFLRWMRNQRHPLLDVFDLPFGISSTANRHVTTTPIQSLLLINGQLLLQQAAALETSLQRETPATSAERIDRAHRLLFARPATSSEIAQGSEFVDAQVRRIDVEQADSAAARFEYGRIPFRDGQAAVVTPAQLPMRVSGMSEHVSHDFTVEAFVVLRSVYDSGAVRVIASSWNGKETEPGWSFGITGKGSRRKPQTPVLQLVGQSEDGKVLHEPLFSDHTIQLNKPYYLAAVVRFAQPDRPGSVEFFVKDLANDDEPLLTATIPHRVRDGIASTFPLTIGGRMSAGDARFDGLIDDVRISATALSPTKLLYGTETDPNSIVGFWRFETQPGVFADASGHGRDLQPVVTNKEGAPLDARQQAWIDYCHVLLNSNEFLYVP